MAWRKQDDHECPCCGAPENTTHVLRCTAQQSCTIWNANMEALTLTMMDFHAPLELQEALPICLNSWRQALPAIMQPHWSASLCDALRLQDAIGWKNFMEGLPGNLWLPYLTAHFTRTNSRKCPRRCLRAILSDSHHLAWAQWKFRCAYLHEDGCPRYKRACSLLHDCIIYEFLKGPTDLLPSDHHHFTYALHDLLSRSTSYQQNWYMNVLAARRRHDRHTHGLEAPLSANESNIIYWIRTRRLR